MLRNVEGVYEDGQIERTDIPSDLSDREWIESVGVKIDAAIAVSEHTQPIDGETFIIGILDRFRQARESQPGYTN